MESPLPVVMWVIRGEALQMVPPESGLPEEHADACAVAKLLWGRLDRARLRVILTHSGGRTPEAIYQLLRGE